MMGYPTYSEEYRNIVTIEKKDSSNFKKTKGTVLNPSANDFVPGERTESTYRIDRVSYETFPIVDNISRTRKCSRCGKLFIITSRKYISTDCCFYHWGKLQRVVYNGKEERRYSCCSQSAIAEGCSTSEVHVWSGLINGINKFHGQFVSAPTPYLFLNREKYFKVYAIDCEMCFTVHGLEIAKVTVVGLGGDLIYSSFVRPESEIIDFNTRFSGITKDDIHLGTKSLREVQNDLMRFITSETILIGHGLENDLRALRLVHYLVVDTAKTFPHCQGFPYRRSLKHLCETILKKNIQGNAGGHDSFEDANACLELMMWRVRRDYFGQ
ncbi:exonuclease GOR-like [Diorhabda carinulata]|uniref:exonuclease GOR-like n=1 Tax=Diorhabda carinulata TaxID=1163345 RepID=UPI0025A28DBE|nr:exonuclease GOR-like [Diorhabda carinulata]